MAQPAKQPIERIQWIKVDLLFANAWNPNFVQSQELELLKLSLLMNGWIQPVLVSKVGDCYQIIDGYHRTGLVRSCADVAALTKGKVPCVVLEMSPADAMMLTVRINRAKGTHVAIKMHELVHDVVNRYDVPVAEVAKKIGATEHEVRTLLLEGVFAKMDVANAEYSRAWVPLGVPDEDIALVYGHHAVAGGEGDAVVPPEEAAAAPPG